MIRLALYLAFGIIFHVLFVGAHFDPTNLWSWLWLLGWPIALFIMFGAVFAVCFVIGLGAVLIWERMR